MSLPPRLQGVKMEEPEGEIMVEGEAGADEEEGMGPDNGREGPPTKRAAVEVGGSSGSWGW